MSADDAVASVLSQVDEWRRSGGQAPAFWLHGAPGTGKARALRTLRNELAQCSVKAVLASPPELALDAPLHLSVQVASELRSYGSNGALDVLGEPSAGAAEKESALLGELRKLEQGVLLVDIPRSWATRPHDSGERFALRVRCTALLSALLAEAVQKGMPLVLATRGSFHWPEEIRVWAKRVKLGPGPTSVEFLGDGSPFGKLSPYARKLESLIGPRAGESSLLELRIAVALLALSYNASDVRAACFGGLRALRQLLAEELGRRANLRTGLAVLSLPRFPLDAAIVDELLTAYMMRGPDSDLEREVIEGVLLLEQDGGLALHPAIRALYDADDATPGDILMHGSITDAILQKSSNAPLLSGWREAVRRLEAVFHAALAQKTAVVRAQAIDSAQLCALARARSLGGEKEAALDLYEEVLAHDPQHQYARAYVAYHLEHLGRDPLRAELLFQASYEDEPTNPWWARRYVCCLIRRGRLAQARETWLEALGRLDVEDEGDDGDEWLARNFHLGIARQFLSRGALEEAREVLTRIPVKIRYDNTELREIWNRLQHMEESERLGGAVFPLSIPFDERWSGPHIDELRSPGKPIDAWYPGRLLRLGERVVLELAEPPEGDEAARLFQSEMSLADFLSCARRSASDLLSEGQFLEVVVAGDDTRIEMHPVQRRGLPVRVGFLRNIEDTE